MRAPACTSTEFPIATLQCSALIVKGHRSVGEYLEQLYQETSALLKWTPLWPYSHWQGKVTETRLTKSRMQVKYALLLAFEIFACLASNNSQNFFIIKQWITIQAIGDKHKLAIHVPLTIIRIQFSSNRVVSVLNILKAGSCVKVLQSTFKIFLKKLVIPQLSYFLCCLF